jgi:hypothetical protein
MADQGSYDVELETLQNFLKQFGKDDEITRIIVEELLHELLTNPRGFSQKEKEDGRRNI